MGKIFLLQGAADSQLWVLSIVLVLMTVVSYYYYLRLAWYVWMRDAREGTSIRELFVPLPLRFALAGAAAAMILLGVFPSATMEFAQSSVAAVSAFPDALASLIP